MSLVWNRAGGSKVCVSLSVDEQIRQPSSKGCEVKRIRLASCFLKKSETWNRNANAQAVVSGLL